MISDEEYYESIEKHCATRNCSNCKNWKKSKLMQDDHGICKEPMGPAIQPVKLSDDALEYIAASDYEELETINSFGCNRHEQLHVKN